MNEQRLPPLAGVASLARAAMPGPDVAETVRLLRRLNFIKTQLIDVGAAFLNPSPEWEVKSALSLHLYLDSEHADSIRKRVSELRLPPLQLDTPPDPALAAFMAEVIRAESTAELIAGVYGIVRPALLAAMRRHLEVTNPLFDFATCRALRIAVLEEEEMIAWGDQAVAAITADADSAGGAWTDHLRRYLASAGGVDGREPIPADDLPASRAAGPFVPVTAPRREAPDSHNYNLFYRASDVSRDTEAPYDERVLALMWKRYHEMDVPEMMATLILEREDRPWSYIHDVSRQLWDECRHALMGEVWLRRSGVDLRRYPNHVGWSLRLNSEMTPVERHIILYGIEQGLMDGRRGKRHEWEIARESGDPLAAYLQDFDWADEVLHAQIGRRWLKTIVGDVHTILRKRDEIDARPSTVLSALVRTVPQSDWWPQIVADVLHRATSSSAGLNGPASPTFRAAVSDSG